MFQQPEQKRENIFEQYAFVKHLTRYPAFTLMVMMRRDIGYRMLDPFTIVGTFGLLAVVSILAMPGNEDARPIDLFIFAVLGFLNATAQRIKRWIDLRRGIKLHSQYIGTSPFQFRWLPKFMRRNRRMSRFVDPIFWLAVGIGIFPYSRALAMYLCLAAFCLRVFEADVWDREEQQDLDTMDGFIEAEYQNQIIEQYEKRPRRGAPVDGAIPTGLADDIRGTMKNRKPD